MTGDVVPFTVIQGKRREPKPEPAKPKPRRPSRLTAEFLQTFALVETHRPATVAMLVETIEMIAEDVEREIE
jgi:hypothetical protein